MSTKSKVISIKKRRSKAQRDLVVCLRNAGYEVSLEPRKLYAVIPDRDAEQHNQLRVVDESGEDYLFPSSLFAAIPVPLALRRALLAAV